MRLALAALVLLCACEPTLPEGWPHDSGVSAPDAGPMRYIAFGDGGAVTVDSMDALRWAALDLDVPDEVPFEADQWDLAFQRFHIRARGGASGDGGVQIALVYDAGYADVTQAPGGPWLEDQPDGVDENEDLDTVFEKGEMGEMWFSYEGLSHILTPRPIVYVIKSDRGAYFKLKLDGYYDRFGTSAVVSFRFAPVLSP